MPAIWKKAVTVWWQLFCYGDEENARIYAVHLTTANQSKMRGAPLVFVDIGAGWVENGRTGENPQPEAEEKQADWVENGRAEGNPQLKVEKKQAGWVENGRAEGNPQPEAEEKQAGWVENGRMGENPQPEAKRSSVR